MIDIQLKFTLNLKYQNQKYLILKVQQFPMNFQRKYLEFQILT